MLNIKIWQILEEEKLALVFIQVVLQNTVYFDHTHIHTHPITMANKQTHKPYYFLRCNKKLF
jgi:hypothetical protein